MTDHDDTPAEGEPRDEEPNGEALRLRMAYRQACRSLVDMNEHATKLTQALDTALLLIDHLLGDLRNNGIVPSAATSVARDQLGFTIKTILNRKPATQESSQEPGPSK